MPVERSAVDAFDLWTRFESHPRLRVREHRPHVTPPASLVVDAVLRGRIADARRARTEVGGSEGIVWFVPDGEHCLVVMASALAVHGRDDLARFAAFVARETLDDALDRLMDAVVRDQGVIGRPAPRPG